MSTSCWLCGTKDGELEQVTITKDYLPSERKMCRYCLQTWDDKKICSYFDCRAPIHEDSNQLCATCAGCNFCCRSNYCLREDGEEEIKDKIKDKIKKEIKEENGDNSNEKGKEEEEIGEEIKEKIDTKVSVECKSYSDAIQRAIVKKCTRSINIKIIDNNKATRIISIPIVPHDCTNREFRFMIASVLTCHVMHVKYTTDYKESVYVYPINGYIQIDYSPNFTYPINDDSQSIKSIEPIESVQDKMVDFVSIPCLEIDQCGVPIPNYDNEHVIVATSYQRISGNVNAKQAVLQQVDWKLSESIYKPLEYNPELDRVLVIHQSELEKQITSWQNLRNKEKYRISMMREFESLSHGYIDESKSPESQHCGIIKSATPVITSEEWQSMVGGEYDDEPRNIKFKSTVSKSFPTAKPDSIL